MVGKYTTLILICLLTATACGRDNQARIVELLAQFKQDAVQNGVVVELNGITVKLVSGYLDNRTGQCNLDSRLIEVQRRWWIRASSACQEQLLYHELGHCVLNRLHLNGYRGPQGFPTSIMRRSIFDCNVYELYRDYYLKELFRF